MSYGGTLQFFGYKGTPLPKAPPAPPASLLHRFFGQGMFNPQGTMGAPSQFASQNAPAASGQGSGSAGSLFLKSFHGHLGNGGGGNGGGGNGGGGNGGGGGLGGEEGTCASDLKVGTNTVSPDDVPTSTGCSWLRLGTGSNEADNLAGRGHKADLVQRDG